MSQAAMLQYYDVTKPVVIQCDASGKGLGAVLLQDSKPVCYASRVLTDAETRYASIVAERLAVVFACHKFHQYIYGRSTVSLQLLKQTTSPCWQMHKTFVTSSTETQKMILNVRGYDVEVRYIPGNKQIVADTLSRAALPSAEEEGYEAFQEINLVLSVSEERYEESINKETTLDGELQAVRTMVTNGWPGTKQQVPTEARPYWSFRDKVATVDGLLFKETRLIVPKSMRAEMFRQIHKRHLGKSSADREAGICYFGLECRSVDIEQIVTNYGACEHYANKQP